MTEEGLAIALLALAAAMICLRHTIFYG